MSASFPRRLIGMLFSILVIALAAQVTSFGVPATVSAATQAGYHDISYPSDIIDTTNSQYPTGEKPQSKLWFNDGLWWAVMYSTANSRFDIFRLNWPDTWVDTGVPADDRGRARADCLWDGTHLYIVSGIYAPTATDAAGGRLYRYSYDSTSKTYSLDTGFPTNVMSGKAEALVMDEDSTGKLWVTYTQSNKVYVVSSADAGATWVTPFVIPGAADIYSDDISAIVAYRDNGTRNAVGVVWSSHSTSGGNPDPTASLYFAYHRDTDIDTTWQIKLLYQGRCVSDDHINLKSLQADDQGRIYAAVKTSLGDAGCSTESSATPTPLPSTTPQTRLLVITSSGVVAQTVFGTVADDHTRPIILLQPDSDKLYMFATSSTSGGSIYMKTTSMSNPDFSNQSGKGDSFISNPQSMSDTKINNATSTKQTITAASGGVVLASDQKTYFYVHNVIGQESTGSATATASITSSSIPSPTLAPSSTVAPSTTATSSVTKTPSVTKTASVTKTPSATKTASATRTASVTKTPSVTKTASATKAPSKTPSVTRTPSATPTGSATP